MNTKENQCMANKVSIWENIIGATLLLGGGFLLLDILGRNAEIKTFYKCPRCRQPRIKWGTPICPNCKVSLEWPGEDETMPGPEGVK